MPEIQCCLTEKTGVAGISNKGFENSEKWFLGKGVYMTDSSHMAYWYAWRKFRQKYCNYVFVNEVCGSEKLRSSGTTILRG